MENTEEKLYFCGRDVEELSREELLKALREVAKQNKRIMESYFHAEKSKIQLMGDCVELYNRTK